MMASRADVKREMSNVHSMGAELATELGHEPATLTTWPKAILTCSQKKLTKAGAVATAAAPAMPRSDGAPAAAAAPFTRSCLKE